MFYIYKLYDKDMFERERELIAWPASARMAASRGILSVTPAPRDCTQDIVMVAVLKSVSVQRFSGKMLQDR